MAVLRSILLIFTIFSIMNAEGNQYNFVTIVKNKFVFSPDKNI